MMMMMMSAPSPMYMAWAYPGLGVTSPPREASSPSAGPPAPGRVAVDHLAGAVGVLRRRVRDHVLEVEQRGVHARAAVDHVALAVAGAEHVVAVAAVQRVALGVVRTVDVRTGERPQMVVALLAPGLVAAGAGVDRVVARAAPLQVVARAAAHQVAAVLAPRLVVAGATPHAVG